MRRPGCRRGALGAAIGCVLGLPAVRAQEPDAPPATSNAELKRGNRTPPTHAPQPVLPPLAAWQHVKDGNAAFVAARQSKQDPPPPAERPGGAGRYVCAAIVCADADLDVPALLGLARKDVLVISTPGPFVQPEVVALLELAASADRLSLVLVLTHTDCRTLNAKATGTATSDTLQRRLALAAAAARQRHRPFLHSIAPLQREQLLAASEPLRELLRHDDLRIMPGEVDSQTGAITWLHDRADAMPLAPVK